MHPYGEGLRVNPPLKPSDASLPESYLEFGQGSVRSLRTDDDIHAEWTFSEKSLPNTLF